MTSVSEIYLQMIEDMSNTLTKRVEDLSDEQLNTRPGAGLNPVGFIYWHILRVWDMDLNVRCRGQEVTNDAWHRGGMTEQFGYEPVGHGGGGRGNGFGFTDAEVDEINYHHSGLRAYHDLILQETRDYLAALDADEFDRMTSHLGNEATVSGRMQHAVTHSQMHIGEIGMSRGLLGFADPTTPARS